MLMAMEAKDKSSHTGYCFTTRNTKTSSYDNIPITPQIKGSSFINEVRDKLEPWRKFVDWIFVSQN